MKNFFELQSAVLKIAQRVVNETVASIWEITFELTSKQLDAVFILLIKTNLGIAFIFQIR